MKVEEALEQAFDAYDKHAPWRGTQIAAFLASLRANGYAVVPVEATTVMNEAGQRYVNNILSSGNASPGQRFYYSDLWRAMLTAAQENDDGTI